MTLTLNEAVTLSVQLHMLPRKLSRQDIADALGITSSAVTARFKGRTKWSLDDVDALCVLLDVPAAELVAPPLDALVGHKVRAAYEQTQHFGRGDGSVNRRERTAARYVLAA